MTTGLFGFALVSLLLLATRAQFGPVPTGSSCTMHACEKPGKGTGSARTVTKPHDQRCAVRVTYLNNRTRGQWKAHGRYLARESAAAGKPDELVS